MVASSTKQKKETQMEYWDIYDSEKKLTGRTMQRNDWKLKDGEYHLTVLGVIRHTDGRYLITKRVMTKAWAPGWWEVPGGAVIAGEKSEEAVVREISEETGLNVTGWEGGHCFTYHRENPGEGDNYFVDVYRFTGEFGENDIKLQEKETADYKLATKEEIKALAKDGIFLHYDSIKQAFER
jgi:8-oxo-dGTP pyrophosphatase MutT (NUDIX family)